MDLPQYLESELLVSGEQELHQTMKILLREERGTFLQDFELGSQITPHIRDSRLIHAAILSALQPIKGLKVEDIDFLEVDTINLIYSYYGEKRTFNFKIDDNK